ncbi:MAG: SDR family NAD(P)-dependent oxidoreductase [Bacteroidia bacterium]|nr:SDR family NAD(P)-dependent oxidoreductase [Bacteroidia bacterium]
MMKRSSLSFNGKVAIVTGSSMGIGKAVSIELCRCGASVVINGRNAEKLNATKNELESMGFDLIACPADVTNYNECEMLVQAAIAKYKKLDILVTCAGVAGRASFETLSPYHFKTIVDSNIYGTVFPARAALPFLKESKGSLVFISSLAGMMGIPYYTAYCSGKMSLTALYQCLRGELKNTGIHTGIVYVGFTKNEEGKQFISADGNLVPVPPRNERLQQPRGKVARSIVNLIKRRKSKMILSPIGKINALLIRYFPILVRTIIERASVKS